MKNRIYMVFSASNRLIKVIQSNKTEKQLTSEYYNIFNFVEIGI